MKRLRAGLCWLRLFSLAWTGCLAGALAAAPLAAQQSTPEHPNAVVPTQPELARELVRRMEADQAARRLFIELRQKGEDRPRAEIENEQRLIADKVQAVDQRNRIWLAETIERFGWPGKSLVGEQAAHAAWLLVQHADADPDFQEKCLERMKAAGHGEVAAADIAYLTDRVLVARGRPQVYGTQCEEVAGSFQPRECIEPERLDQRRKEMGLSPMSEYLRQMSEIYRPRDD